MNDNQRETLINWLNDAHALEQDIVETLERQIDQLDTTPNVQEKVREHLETTKNQASRLKECIERLGGSVSPVKSVIANVMGAAKGMSTATAEDKMIKNSLADYATEHFEIASYRALIAAADAVGEEETARVCEEILKEEEAMAKWVNNEIPRLVKAYIISQ